MYIKKKRERKKKRVVNVLPYIQQFERWETKRRANTSDGNSKAPDKIAHSCVLADSSVTKDRKSPFCIFLKRKRVGGGG